MALGLSDAVHAKGLLGEGLLHKDMLSPDRPGSYNPAFTQFRRDHALGVPYDHAPLRPSTSLLSAVRMASQQSAQDPPEESW